MPMWFKAFHNPMVGIECRNCGAALKIERKAIVIEIALLVSYLVIVLLFIPYVGFGFYILFSLVVFCFLFSILCS